MGRPDGPHLHTPRSRELPTLASRRWVEAMVAGMGSEEVAVEEQWQSWVVGDGQIGGWAKRWGSTTGNRSNSDPTRGGPRGELVFATVRGAGHQVPTFQPRRAFELFRGFLQREF